MCASWSPIVWPRPMIGSASMSGSGPCGSMIWSASFVNPRSGRRGASHERVWRLDSGWQSHLAILIDVLNGHEPHPFWTTVTRMEAEYERRIPAG
jgi:hypothetical protein